MSVPADIYISCLYGYGQELALSLLKIANSDDGKEILTKATKSRLKKSKFHKNGKFDFLTACHEIKFH